MRRLAPCGLGGDRGAELRHGAPDFAPNRKDFKHQGWPEHLLWVHVNCQELLTDPLTDPQACMLQHSYFLQYHLYTVAADLYLTRRIPGYQYDKHFGGIFYVFFRGLDPENSSHGIFHDRPAASLVCALRQLLIGGLP